MRKIYAAMVTGVLILCLWGCGNGKNAETSVKELQKTNAAGTAFVSLDNASAALWSGVQDAAGEKALEMTVANKDSGTDGAVAAGNIIEIKEKLFIAQTNDVYLNPDDYLGKTLKLEGLFKKAQYEDRSYCFVIRYGPGCCGSDGNAGFEIAWNMADKTYPAEDDWVEASGILKTYMEDDYPYLYIALSSLTVLDKRGAEFVSQ